MKLSEDKKRLAENFFSLSVLQAFTYILPLLTLPYLARVLGADKFGLVMFAQAFVLFFNVFVDYGFNLYATKEISIHRDDKSKVTEVYSSVMLIKVFLMSISFCLLTMIVFGIDRFSSDWTLYYLTFIWVVGQALFPVWFFQGVEKMKYITFVNVISKIVFAALIFLVIRNENDYLKVPVLNGFGSLVGACISLLIVCKVCKQRFKFYRIKVLEKHLIKSTQFFLSRFSVAIYASSNAFVVGLFVGNEVVGYYSIADKLYQALQQVYHPIVQSLYPYVAKEKNISLYKKIFTLAMLLNILTIGLLYLLGGYVFDLLFTASIGSESVKVFHILLLAALAVVPSMLLGYPLLGALGFEKQANASVIGGSVFHLFGLGLIILLDGVTIYAVAYVLLVTEILVLLSRIYWVKSGSLWQKQ